MKVSAKRRYEIKLMLNISENEHKGNVSVRHISAAAQTGMRFVDYLTTVKLKRAAYLIMNTNHTIGEIAERLDFKVLDIFHGYLSHAAL